MKQKIVTIAFGIMVLLVAVPFLSKAENAKKISDKTRSWIGVYLEDVTPKFAREKELKIKEGAYVSDVVDDSPADSSGIKEGDVIIEFNNVKIEQADDLVDAVHSVKVGDKVSVSLMRKDAKKTFSLVVGKVPKPKNHFPFEVNISKTLPRIMMFNSSEGIEGLKLMELNKQLGKYFEAPNNKGLLVEEVKKNSTAEKAGIAAGDVIYKINGSTVEEIGDMNDAIEDVETGKKVDVELIRKGVKKTVSVEITEQKEKDFMFQFGGHGMRMMPPGGFRFENFDCDDCNPMDMQIEHNRPDNDKKIEKKIIIKKGATL